MDCLIEFSVSKGIGVMPVFLPGLALDWYGGAGLHGECKHPLVQPGEKKNPFCVRPYWHNMTPYAQTILPGE